MKQKKGKILLLIIAVLTAATFIVMFFVRDASFDEKTGTVDIILFSGQSNMVGYGKEPSTYKITNGEAYEYLGESNELTDVVDPVGERHSEDDGEINEGSMIPSFVYYYLENSENKVIAVSSACGGTSIEKWQPGGERLNETIEKYNKAIDYIEKYTNYDIGKKILVWMQGETDVLKGITGVEYEEKFMNTYNELKADAGIDECILIPIGSRNDAPYENAEVIIKAQYHLIDNNDDIKAGSENVLKYSKDPNMIKSDNLHFTTETLELIGKESALNYFSNQISSSR